MANLTFSIDTKKLQRNLEKQIQKAINEQRTSLSGDLQTSLGDSIMLDKMGEDALQAILKLYDGNDSLSVSGIYDAFPKYMGLAINDAFIKLKYSGYLASSNMHLGGWSVNLTPSAITYFEDKQRYMERNMSMFNKLPFNLKKLLDEILQAENPSHMLCERFKDCSSNEDKELRSLLRELTQEGYINIQWGSDMPYRVEINNSARTYEEREAEYERQLKVQGGVTYNVQTINANAGIVTLGDVINTEMSIDNSVQRIEREIESSGGEDKEALRDLLAEARELIENINSTRQIPKNRSFFKRLSTHLDKHGWFYGEIISLIGTASLMLIGS